MAPSFPATHPPLSPLREPSVPTGHTQASGRKRRGDPIEQANQSGPHFELARRGTGQAPRPAFDLTVPGRYNEGTAAERTAGGMSSRHLHHARRRHANRLARPSSTAARTQIRQSLRADISATGCGKTASCFLSGRRCHFIHLSPGTPDQFIGARSEPPPCSIAARRLTPVVLFADEIPAPSGRARPNPPAPRRAYQPASAEMGHVRQRRTVHSSCHYYLVGRRRLRRRALRRSSPSCHRRAPLDLHYQKDWAWRIDLGVLSCARPAGFTGADRGPPGRWRRQVLILNPYQHRRVVTMQAELPQRLPQRDHGLASARNIVEYPVTVT